MKADGKLEKMKVEPSSPVRYELPLDYELVSMNELIGKEISFVYRGEIRCINCDKRIHTAFGQGFCYTCFREAPQNSECIIRPELCRGHLGEGRDPQWEEEHHNKPHAVYLALTSAIKIGVTRWTEIPTRWIDQGAYRAMVIAKTPHRRMAGEIELIGKELFTDRTSWQRMLKDERIEGVDLAEERERLRKILPAEYASYIVDDFEAMDIEYPLSPPPQKVKSVNLDKQPVIIGVLAGIRGQYLVFEDNSVLNIRRFTGYVVEITA